VQPLDCYQNEMHQGESRTGNHSHSKPRHIRYHSSAVSV